MKKRMQKNFAFADLEKASNQGHRDVVWWALRKLVAEEWLVKIAQLVHSLIQPWIEFLGLSVMINWSNLDYIKAHC